MVTETSCSKQEVDFIYFDGKNGQNGYSVSIFYNDLGNTEDYYWERDNIPGFTAGDTVVYQKNMEGFLIKRDGKCVSISQISGIDTTEREKVCDGDNGTNGFNTVYGSRSMIENGKVIGSYLDFYWDNDLPGDLGYGILSENDIWKLTVPILNGEKGEKGNTPDYRISTSEKDAYGCFTLTIAVGDSILSEKKICDGKPGDRPILTKTYLPNGIVFKWTIGNEISEDFFPYAVDGVDGVDGTDGTNGENGADGQDGNDAPLGTSIACITQHFNFQGVNANYFSNTGIVATGSFNYSPTDGALYCTSNGGSIMTPPTTENNKLLYYSFKYGTRKAFKITVKIIHYNDPEEILSEFTFNGNPNFQRNMFATYGKFEYKADLNNIRFSNVKNIKIIVESSSTNKNTTNVNCNDSQDFFLDDNLGLFGWE